MIPAWNADQRLDILILGPMSDDETTAASCVPVQKAVQALLDEPELDEFLTKNHIAPEDRQVHAPESFRGANIFDSVLSRLDTADLVIFNLTPKPGKEEASANVFYELALVHALGIPAMFLYHRPDKKAQAPSSPPDNEPPKQVPFYAREMHQLRVKKFDRATLVEALRPTLHDFLMRKNAQNNYLNDRVTRFYGLPVIDISAATGLATGYYFNFLSRLITENSFLGSHPHLIKKVVLVRPTSVDSTYQADLDQLKTSLAAAGHTLATEKLSPPAHDKLGPLWFDHVNGIVIDIPRTIYPLQLAPRLLSLQDRHRTQADDATDRIVDQRLHQFGDQLMDRFMHAIRYQIRRAGTTIRGKLVHFTTMGEAASDITQLLSSTP